MANEEEIKDLVKLIEKELDVTLSEELKEDIGGVLKSKSKLEEFTGKEFEGIKKGLSMRLAEHIKGKKAITSGSELSSLGNLASLFKDDDFNKAIAKAREIDENIAKENIINRITEKLMEEKVVVRRKGLLETVTGGIMGPGNEIEQRVTKYIVDKIVEKLDVEIGISNLKDKEETVISNAINWAKNNQGTITEFISKTDYIKADNTEDQFKEKIQPKLDGFIEELPETLRIKEGHKILAGVKKFKSTQEKDSKIKMTATEKLDVQRNKGQGSAMEK